MMSWERHCLFLRRAVLVLGLASGTLAVTPSAIQAHDDDFDLLGSATLDIGEDERRGRTRVTIRIQQGIPDHFYTVWIRMKPHTDGTKANPFTDTNSTPLAPTWAIADLLRETAPDDLAAGVELPRGHCSERRSSCGGTTDLINGLLTDDEGDGVLEVTLDFLVSEGVYPFEEFDSGFREAYIIRANDLWGGVASGGTLRVVSHLTDNLGHGLVPGPHELSFDFVLP